MPSVIHDSYIPLHLSFSRKELEDNECSIYKIFNKSGIFPTYSKVTLEAIGATGKVAKTLELKVGTPLLCLQAIVYDGNDSFVQLSKGIYHSDLYKFSVRVEKQ